MARSLKTQAEWMMGIIDEDWLAVHLPIAAFTSGHFHPSTFAIVANRKDYGDDDDDNNSIYKRLKN